MSLISTHSYHQQLWRELPHQTPAGPTRGSMAAARLGCPWSLPIDQQSTELRFFGGLQEKEIAEEPGISEITVKRDWKFARAFLSAMLASE